MNTDLEVLSTDASAIEAAADPARYVIEACERAKAWLANVLDHGDIDQIIELKSQAEAIRVYTRQKELGKDAELSAAEIVRRAERGIGLAIRKGQADGTIRRAGQTARRPGHAAAPGQQHESPRRCFKNDRERRDTYAMTDGVSDPRFEHALAEAKADGELTRANVVRKITQPPRPERPEMLRKTRHHDSNRIVEQTVIALEGIRAGLDLIDYSALDQSRTPGWSGSLKQSVRSLNRLIKELNP